MGRLIKEIIMTTIHKPLDTETSPLPGRFDMDLHIGVRQDEMDRFLSLCNDSRAETFVDGDGWRVWGEAVGTDRNDDITWHAIIRCEYAIELMARVQWLMAHNFVKEEWKNVHISSSLDWAAPVSSAQDIFLFMREMHDHWYTEMLTLPEDEPINTEAANDV